MRNYTETATTTNHLNRATGNLAAEEIDFSQPKAIVNRAEDRQWFNFVPNETFSVRIRSEHVGGAYSILEGIIDPQSAPPLHVHLHQDEILEILEGSLRIICEGEVFDAPAGTSVVIPKGAIHTWKNVTDQQVRVLGTAFPGGAETVFEQFVGKTLAEMEEIAKRYGTIFVGPPMTGDEPISALAAQKIVVPQRKAIINRPEDRQWFNFIPSETLTVRIRSEDVGGAYTIIEGIMDSQSGPPLHVHLYEDEVFEVLEGSLRIICEGEVFDAPVGTSVVIPKGAIHTWKNVTDKPIRILGTVFPGGVENMFEEFVGKTPAEMEEIGRQHGTIFVGPPMTGNEPLSERTQKNQAESRANGSVAGK